MKTEFITFIRINRALPCAAKYVLWMSPAIADCIEITSYEDSAAEASMRAMRLFASTGDLALICDHTTVPAATAIRSCVAMKLRCRLIPVLNRPFPVPVDTPVRPPDFSVVRNTL